MNDSTKGLRKKMRESEHDYSRKIKIMKGIRRVFLAIFLIWSVCQMAESNRMTEIARADVDGIIATLQNNDGEFISEMIGGENKFGTGPVRDSYTAMADSNMIGQLENVNGFIAKAQYPSDKGTLASEWGSISNVRFFLSSRGSLTTAGSLLAADVYNVFVTAQEAYCNVDLDGSSAQFIYHPPGWGDDPIELRQTGGYRFAYATRITNDAWIINLRATLA